MGGYHRPGYIRPAEILRRPITSTVSNVEHAKLAALAKAAGQPTTTYATQVLRDHLAAHPVMPVAKINAAEVA
jgi:hypothetical protein